MRRLKNTLSIMFVSLGIVVLLQASVMAGGVTPPPATPPPATPPPATPPPATPPPATPPPVAGPTDHSPIGQFINCSLISGATHIFGWAYDPEVAAGDSISPQVIVTVATATVTKNSAPVPSDLLLGLSDANNANAVIEAAYPAASGFSRNGPYGFEYTLTGMTVADAPVITGTIIDYVGSTAGGAANATLGYSTPGFWPPIARIPDSCLAPAPTTTPPPTTTSNFCVAGAVIAGTFSVCQPCATSVSINCDPTNLTSTVATCNAAGAVVNPKLPPCSEQLGCVATGDCRSTPPVATPPIGGTDNFPGFGSPKTNDCNPDSGPINQDNCQIIKYINLIIDALSALVGIVIIAGIVMGGVQYSSAGDNPKNIAAAKTKITNAIMAFLIFIFMFAFLQWLIPGGVL